VHLVVVELGKLSQRARHRLRLVVHEAEFRIPSRPALLQ
jgi:hypothetical protein